VSEIPDGAPVAPREAIRLGPGTCDLLAGLAKEVGAHLVHRQRKRISEQRKDRGAALGVLEVALADDVNPRVYLPARLDLEVPTELCRR
jgi:hypothetical protein